MELTVSSTENQLNNSNPDSSLSHVNYKMQNFFHPLVVDQANGFGSRFWPIRALGVHVLSSFLEFFLEFGFCGLDSKGCSSPISERTGHHLVK